MYPKKFFEEHNADTKNGTCFVLMPFSFRFREVYDAIVDALEGAELNFSCNRADDFFGGGHIIEDILRSIGESEIIIADVTDKNPNVFYELGIAHMVKDIEKVLMLTQQIEDVPFDLRHLRCLRYEQNEAGLRRLKRQLVDSVQEISVGSYRFAVKQGQPFKFTQRLLGPDRCFYDFEIPQLWAGNNAAKFSLAINRHVLGEPVKTIRRGAGIACGKTIPMNVIPWELKLERVSADTAHFTLVPESPSSNP